MSIRPVDFQISIPRTLDTSKTLSDELHRNSVIQHQQAIQTQRKSDNNIKQVYSKDKAQEAKIREKQSESRKQGNRQRREPSSRDGGNKDNKMQSKKGFQSGVSTTIDIRL